jgi:ABC-type Zn uptake system ZnuABC Zn-binding protein ZnuA
MAFESIPLRRVEEDLQHPLTRSSWPATLAPVAQLLDGLDLGQATVFVGEYGAGKSTLVEAIARLLPARRDHARLLHLLGGKPWQQAGPALPRDLAPPLTSAIGRWLTRDLMVLTIIIIRRSVSPVNTPQLLLPALAVTAVLVLAGCSTPGPAASAGGDSDLRVVATTTQVADLTRNIVGDTAGVEVTQLIQPNQSAHSYDPSVADLTALGAADVLVINGVGLEEWLDDAIEASGFDGITVDSDEGITVQDGEAGHEDEAEHAGETEAEHAAEEAEHDHSGGNPHIWTAVANAEAMVGTIAAGLTAASSTHAADFEANEAAYAGRLAELDGWIHENIDAVPADQRLLVSNHDAFGYFTDAYGITYVGSVIPSFDDNAEPSAAEIDELVAAITATGVKAVFSEASINPKAADTIATEAGVAVYSGADALYGDSLGPVGSDGDTYIASQLHNVRLILESWGVTPSAVPADLQ